MTNSLVTVLASLDPSLDAPEADLDEAVSHVFSQRERKVLMGAIRGIALSRPAFGTPRKSDYNGSALWSTPLTSSQGVGGELHVLLDDDDRIAGVRFTLNNVGTPASAETLHERLTDVSEVASVYTVRGSEIANRGPRHIAIASLVKLVVIGAVLDAIAVGVMAADTRVAVKGSDISFLSVGLNESSVGTEISVLDLCVRALAYSDNTAFDVLLRVVGDAAVAHQLTQAGWHPSAPVSIRPMRALILAGWGDDDGGTHAAMEARIRERSVETVVHQHGLDYYVPLDVIVPIHRRVALSPVLTGLRGLTPYPGFSYKGGSAPGVFGGSWVSAKYPDVAVAFAINSSLPFGALEEAYSIDQALRFAQCAVSARESN